MPASSPAAIPHVASADREAGATDGVPGAAPRRNLSFACRAGRIARAAPIPECRGYRREIERGPAHGVDGETRDRAGEHARQREQAGEQCVLRGRKRFSVSRSSSTENAPVPIPDVSNSKLVAEYISGRFGWPTQAIAQ